MHSQESFRWRVLSPRCDPGQHWALCSRLAWPCCSLLSRVSRSSLLPLTSTLASLMGRSLQFGVFDQTPTRQMRSFATFRRPGMLILGEGKSTYLRNPSASSCYPGSRNTMKRRSTELSSTSNLSVTRQLSLSKLLLNLLHTVHS